MLKNPRLAGRVRSPWPAFWALVVVTAAAFAFSAYGSISLYERAAAPVTVANEVGYAPGYDWDVAAAGYAACGQLQRGATVDEVIASSVAYGIRGDLYPRDGVERLVASATEHLCPELVAR